MTNPLVSVIIATYRRDTSLDKAIESTCNQTYSPIEIIVVDDNDEIEWNKKVRRIVEKWKGISNVSIVLFQNHPNQGSAKTRNKGIELSHGEYICFLDDDDLYLPNRVKNQIENMSNDKADYSLTDLDLYNEDETISERRKRSYLKKEGDNLLLCHLKYHMTGTDTMMFKKEYLLKIGCFEPIDVGDEFYLMMKAIIGKGKFSYLPQSDVKAYVHTVNSGLSSGKGKIKGENELFDYKKKFFSHISKKDTRYIKMRHHAVLAFAQKRTGNLYGFFMEGVKSFFSSPVDCIDLIKNLR